MTHKYTLLGCILFSITPSFARIIQRDSITSVLTEIKDDQTMVVFDLDHTLVKGNYSTELTEPAVVDVFNALRTRGITCVCLTARLWYPENVTHTKKQLASFGISFTDTAKFHQQFTVTTPNGESGHTEGIMFAGTNDKGKMLLSLLLLGDYNPRFVVVIDDRLKYVQAFDAQLTRYSIPHVCIHYQPTGADLH